MHKFFHLVWKFWQKLENKKKIIVFFNQLLNVIMYFHFLLMTGLGMTPAQM